MPRGSRSRRATATLEPEIDNPTSAQESTVTAATDYDTEDDTAQFDLSMEPAPEDYTPDRRTPGRQRRASYFDDRLRATDVFDTGKWQRVPITSDEHKAYVLRELNRAKLFLNGAGRRDGEPEIGLDLDDKKDDAVYFKSRPAQKRERKNGNDALAANAAEDGAIDPDGDNDE